MQKSEENLETLQLATECYGINKNQSLIKIKPVVPEKNAKKWRKFGKFAISCRVTQHEQKSKFDQDQTSSSWEKYKKVKKIWKFGSQSINKNQSLIKIRPVVPEKNAKSEENLETLQLAAECYNMNKNQSLIKIKSVVPEKNDKNWEICETLQLSAECHSMNKNQSLMKTSSSSDKCQKVRKFWNFTIGCRVPKHKQKSKFDEDQISSSWEICKKVKKIWKHCKWLQSAAS